MIAMDQRGSLQKMLHPENPRAATYAEMEAVKLGVTEALAPHASGYLLDPEFGVAPTINRFVLPARTGLLVALEQSGYEKKGNWRLTTLLDGWSVEKVKRLGTRARRRSRTTRPTRSSAPRRPSAPSGSTCSRPNSPETRRSRRTRTNSRRTAS